MYSHAAVCLLASFAQGKYWSLSSAQHINSPTTDLIRSLSILITAPSIRPIEISLSVSIYNQPNIFKMPPKSADSLAEFLLITMANSSDALKTDWHAVANAVGYSRAGDTLSQYLNVLFLQAFESFLPAPPCHSA